GALRAAPKRRAWLFLAARAPDRTALLRRAPTRPRCASIRDAIGCDPPGAKKPRLRPPHRESPPPGPAVPGRAAEPDAAPRRDLVERCPRSLPPAPAPRQPGGHPRRCETGAAKSPA